ncbi:MAG: putative transporter ATP-binding protein [Parachlamydiales bacterium]|nr:putative transporter ATP-binding protein [Parachlamydiales bacterium]
MMSENLYEVKELFFSYSLGKQKIEAIRGLSLNIPTSALVTISGPSGSGKSTLLNILGLIEPAQQGTVIFQNEDIGSMGEKRKNQIRKFQIGFIFQQFHLIPVLSAEENVRYFLSRQKLPKNEIEERIEESLQAVGLWEHRMKKPSELSGGQKQRVAIARAVAKRPHVIIGDEPTASLDQKTGCEIMEILANLVAARKSSVILTTHDAMVQSFSTQNFHIQDGRL